MSLFVEIESLVSAQLEVVKTAISILKLETRLAGLSVYPLLLTLCLLLIGLMGVWTCAMLALGYILVMVVPNTLLCILALLLLNTGIVFGLLRYLLFNLKNMSFEKTRQYIANQEKPHVQSKKTAYPRNCRDESKITLPAKRSNRAES
ncbi:MAG: hypothetical protein KBB94_06300 [Legionellaceae bacterium]|nr:hypothetical protein [Legionellaceae bacterium]MBP9775750.1 hypothetical protein [Legionellaceae bacterium]